MCVCVYVCVCDSVFVLLLSIVLLLLYHTSGCVHALCLLLVSMRTVCMCANCIYV